MCYKCPFVSSYFPPAVSVFKISHCLVHYLQLGISTTIYASSPLMTDNQFVSKAHCHRQLLSEKLLRTSEILLLVWDSWVIGVPPSIGWFVAFLICSKFYIDLI